MNLIKILYIGAFCLSFLTNSHASNYDPNSVFQDNSFVRNKTPIQTRTSQQISFRLKKLSTMYKEAMESNEDLPFLFAEFCNILLKNYTQKQKNFSGKREAISSGLNDLGINYERYQEDLFSRKIPTIYQNVLISLQNLPKSFEDFCNIVLNYYEEVYDERTQKYRFTTQIIAKLFQEKGFTQKKYEEDRQQRELSLEWSKTENETPIEPYNGTHPWLRQILHTEPTP